ncbi:MAG TPA: hypothetical protein VFU40_07540, partial [Gemmatimonadales bacterium]|nr:hypothetical protein [Gemmatimonadales bacterium]
MRPRVVVVQPIPEDGLRMLQQVAEVEVFQSERMMSRDELLAWVKRCDYLYTLGDTPIDAEVLDANPNLKGIAAMTMVPNVIDVDAMTARKIPLTNIPHIITKTTCDLTWPSSWAWPGGWWKRIASPAADAFARSSRCPSSATPCPASSPGS